MHRPAGTVKTNKPPGFSEVEIEGERTFELRNMKEQTWGGYANGLEI